MTHSARLAVLLVTLAGLVIAGWTIGWSGLAHVTRAMGQIGVGGFALYCLWSLALFVVLGLAWLMAAPGEPLSRLPLFSWARMVRDAASDLLPFSHIGGLALGARTVTSAGVAPARVYGAMVVDLTTEMASQLVYTVFGLALMASILAGSGPAAALRPMILGGTGVMIVIVIALLSMQHLALRLASGMAERFLPRSAGGLANVREELARIYGQRRRVLLAFLANLLGWIMSAAGGWIVLRLMGTGLPIWQVLSLESLIFALRSMAFFVPGAIGVQEAGYVLVSGLFGLSPEIALAFSLIKRAREIALGVPTLLVWQAMELRAIGTRAKVRSPDL